MILFLVTILGSAYSKLNCQEKSEFTPSKQVYKFVLPPLPYGSTFLEPFLTSSILYAHHDHHHQTYVDKLNAYVQQNKDLQKLDLSDLVYAATNDQTLQKHAGGVYNHNLYWNVITSPYCAKAAPEGTLMDKINAQWGSFTNFVNEFKAKMRSFIGSGWVWACVNQSGDIEIRTTVNQINPLMKVNSSICYPFVGNDIWEHAYYLKYLWDRNAYIDAFFSAVDWERVEIFYELYSSQQEEIPL